MADVSGIAYFKINGVRRHIEGDWTFNLGKDMKEPLVGTDGYHGEKVTKQAATLEGQIRNTAALPLEDIVTLSNATITLEQANGKVFVLYEASFVNPGEVTIEEGVLAAKFAGPRAEELEI